MALKRADVERQYSQNPDLRREDVAAIFDWLKKQPHLPEMTELQVILFLKACDSRIETAKIKIENYFTVRTHCPDIFDSASADVIKATLSVEAICALPKRTPEGYVVLSCKLVDYKPEKYVCVNHLKVGNMTLALNAYLDGAAEGVVLLADTKGATIGHLARTNFSAVKTLVYFVQEAAPMKIRGMHYVNLVPVTEKAVNLVKPLMKKELANLIHLHSSFDSLHKLIPKKCLPEDYGGELPPLIQLRDESMKRLIENLDFFNWLDRQKVDESKRVGRSPMNNAFGVEGSFKKLELD